MINHLSELININNRLILNVCLSTSQVNLLVAGQDGARGEGGEMVSFSYLANINMQDVYEWVI